MDPKLNWRLMYLFPLPRTGAKFGVKYDTGPLNRLSISEVLLHCRNLLLYNKVDRISRL